MKNSKRGKKWRRPLSLLLTLALIFSMCSITAFAEEEGSGTDDSSSYVNTQDISPSSTEGEPVIVDADTGEVTEVDANSDADTPDDATSDDALDATSDDASDATSDDALDATSDDASDATSDDASDEISADTSSRSNALNRQKTYTIVESGTEVTVSDGKSLSQLIGNSKKLIVEGTLNIENGNVSIPITINEGGVVNIIGGKISGAIIVDGGTLNISGGTVSSSITVNSGSVEMTDGTLKGNIYVNNGSAKIIGGTFKNDNNLKYVPEEGYEAVLDEEHKDTYNVVQINVISSISENKEIPTVSLSFKSGSTSGINYIGINANRTVPDGYEVTEYGILYGTNSSYGYTDATLDLTEQIDVVDYLKTNSKTTRYKAGNASTTSELGAIVVVSADKYVYALAYVKASKNGVEEVYYSDLGKTTYNLSSPYEALIGTTGYTTLTEAISAVQSGGTIRVIKTSTKFVGEDAELDFVLDTKYIVQFGGTLSFVGGNYDLTYIDFASSSKISISDGYFKGDYNNITDDDTVNISISGGYFQVKPDETWVENGYEIVDNEDETYLYKVVPITKEPEINYAARIDDTYYVTFEEAYKASNDGETIELLADVFLDYDLQLDKDITVDMNEYTIQVDEGVTIITAGTFNSIKDNTDKEDFNAKEGTLVIRGGTYSFDPSKWVDDGYEAVKNDDGTYTVQKIEYVIIEIKSNEVSSLSVQINGADVEPTYSYTVKKGTVIKATVEALEGYKLIGWYSDCSDKKLSEDTSYEFTANEDATYYVDIAQCAARIDDTYYVTFEEAYKAADDGETIELLADVFLDYDLKLDKDITVDMNEYTIQVEKGVTTITAGTFISKQDNTDKEDFNAKEGTLIIRGGTYSFDPSKWVDKDNGYKAIANEDGTYTVYKMVTVTAINLNGKETADDADSETKEFIYGTKVSALAVSSYTSAGVKYVFEGWYIDGTDNKVANSNEYIFIATEDIVLRAKYTADATAIQDSVDLSFTASAYGTKQIYFSATRMVVGDNIQSAGIIYGSNADTFGDKEDIEHLLQIGKADVKQKAVSSASNTGSCGFKLTLSNNDKIIYARAYVILSDGTIKYTKVISASYNDLKEKGSITVKIQD